MSKRTNNTDARKVLGTLEEVKRAILNLFQDNVKKSELFLRIPVEY